MTDLSCYGPDIEALADLAGDFDLRSPVDTRTWYRQTWESIAEALGFPQQLTPSSPADAAPASGSRPPEAGMAAFMARMRQTRPAVTDRQASTQMTVIEQMTSASRARGELWRVTVDPTTLETGACYEDDSGGLSRAFYPDTTPGYFGDGWPGPPPRAESRCGWETPLVLHFGTFPWVYSSRLDAAGPGLRWISPSLTPAIEGFRVMTSFLQPEANLQQDARQVVTIYRHFAAQTAPLVARVPAQPGARRGRPALPARGPPARASREPACRRPRRPPRPPAGAGLQPYRPALRRLLRRPAGDPPRPGVGPRDEAPRGQHQRPVPARPGRGGGPCWLNTV
jgi:hypothetical protein